MKSWFQEIDHATTEAQLVATTRDLCALYSPRELAPFPEDCRVIRIDGVADIPRWREKLARNLGPAREHAENAAKLDDLVQCFEHASERLDALRPQAEAAGAGYVSSDERAAD
jgi:hypothetical protein